MKNQKSKLYIAYGSNLNLVQMSIRCPKAKVVGKSEIKDYALLFRGSKYSAVATIEPQKGTSVPVLLWKISPENEMALDRYEGYPNFYEKQMMELDVNGEKVTAMAYIMTPGHCLGYPSDYYFEVIEDGYKMADFNLSVLDEAVQRTESMMENEILSQLPEMEL